MEWSGANVKRRSGAAAAADLSGSAFDELFFHQPHTGSITGGRGGRGNRAVALY
jgi:hypothetical protein